MDGRRLPRSARKLSAYLAFWLLAASVVTGMMETWQALFGRYVGAYWDWLHLWTSIAALPSLAHRLVAGQNLRAWTPAPAGAPESGDYEEMAARAKQLAAARKLKIYGLNENGGTHVIIR